jgi:hypothetical protein
MNKILKGQKGEIINLEYMALMEIGHLQNSNHCIDITLVNGNRIVLFQSPDKEEVEKKFKSVVNFCNCQYFDVGTN